MAQIVHNDTLPGMWVCVLQIWKLDDELTYLQAGCTCWWYAWEYHCLETRLWFVADHSSIMQFRCITSQPHAPKHVALVTLISGGSNPSTLDELVIRFVEPCAVIGNVFWKAGFQCYCCLCTFHCSLIPVTHWPHISSLSKRYTGLVSTVSDKHKYCWRLSMSVMGRWIKTNSGWALLMRASAQGCQYRSQQQVHS